jgi:hypothetical protein
LNCGTILQSIFGGQCIGYPFCRDQMWPAKARSLAWNGQISPLIWTSVHSLKALVLNSYVMAQSMVILLLVPLTSSSSAERGCWLSQMEQTAAL